MSRGLEALKRLEQVVGDRYLVAELEDDEDAQEAALKKYMEAEALFAVFLAGGYVKTLADDSSGSRAEQLHRVADQLVESMAELRQLAAD